MSKYKLVVCDVDGTIMDSNHLIPSQLIDLVAKLHERGVYFSLASARPTLSLLHLGEILKLRTPLIALNGSLIINQINQILYSKQFLFTRVTSILQKFPNVIVNSYRDMHWYVNQYNDFIAHEEKCVRVKPQVGDDFPLQSNMVVLNAEYEQLLSIQHYIQEHEPDLSAVFSHERYLHIASRGVCKASGVVELAQLCDVSLNEVIAFGDGENDISMLQEVGLGVAMANASVKVKQAANKVTDTNYNLGVVKFLTTALADGFFG